MSAPLDQPYRGSGADRPVGVPLPPDPMPLFRAGTLRKRWHYVAFWSAEAIVCAARVHVFPLWQEYWGVLDRRDASFRQRTRWLGKRLALDARRLAFDDGDVSVELPYAPDDQFELYRPMARAYIWARKQFCARATATIRLGSRRWQPQGVVFVDVNDGYHPRRTQWRWSAGAGTDPRGRTVAWSAVVGMFDTRRNSERVIWVDGVQTEPAPVTFTPDLRTMTFGEGGQISFRQEANLRQRINLLLLRVRYDHAFGRCEGTLPGGIELRNAVGVQERQDALW